MLHSQIQLVNTKKVAKKRIKRTTAEAVQVVNTKKVVKKRRKRTTATAASFRRIRIRYDDMDATDTSDNEGDARPKRVVEIFHTPPHVFCSLEQPKYKGVRQRNWGRWAADIRNPVSGCRDWLGTFDSAEASPAAYQSAAKQFKAKRSGNADDSTFFTKCDLAALNEMPFWAAMRRLEAEILIPPPITTTVAEESPPSSEDRSNHIEKYFAMKQQHQQQQQQQKQQKQQEQHHSSTPIDSFVKFETTLDDAFNYDEQQPSDFVIGCSELVKLDGWFENEY